MLNKLVERPGAELFLFFLMIFAVVTSGCSSGNDTAPSKTFNLDYSSLAIAQVARATVAKEIEFDGVVEAVNQAVVSAQTSGRIVELPFDVGDYVAKGAIIARFTDTEQQAAFAAARAQLEEARARFAEANQQFARISDVFEKGLVAKAAYDQAEAGKQAAQARVESAEAALKDARERLSHTVVEAPYSGIVVKRMTDVGAAVAPGSPLLEGLSLDHLRVRVDIPQEHIGSLRQHKKARVILGSGQSLQIESMRIPPSANISTHSFPVLLQMPEGQQGTPVFPGTLAKVAIVSGQQQALLVPDTAIASRGEVTAVYVLTDRHQVEFRYIRLGEKAGDTHTVVLAGLSEGETIMLDPVSGAVAYKSQSYSEKETAK